MLCERCERFDIQAFGRDPYPYRGVPLLSVVRSSNHCSFCSLLLESLQKAHKHVAIKELIDASRGSQQLATQLLRCYCKAPATLLRDNWVNFALTKATKQPVAGSDGLNVASIDAFLGSVDDEDPKRLGFVRFHVAADPGTPASTSQDITGQIVMDRPWSSTESIESVQTWHRECVSDHPKCCKTLSGTQPCQVESPRLPTRCIETVPVVTQDDARPWCHILRETADQRGKYISLSHRWNEETEKSKTTRANYMCRMGKCLQKTDHIRPCISEIDWMPLDFADTCILAYGLVIKYVWIDSICIKQDDDAELNREAPRMAQYYQNAWITVVAANKVMANGLLNIRRTEPVPRMTRLPYMDRNGEKKGYFYIQLARPDVLREEFAVGVEKSELLQRGWVFQEWKLSRRIIAFSDLGFFLYCHTSGSTSPMGDVLDEAGVRLGQKAKRNGHMMQRGYFSPSEQWEDLVTEYSGLGLTYLAKDRLVALAGVASEFGRIMKAIKDTSSIPGPISSDDVSARRYVSGSWLTNIPKGLLWEQATRGTRERLPGIPTWSWASMSSPIIDENNKRVLIGMRVRWPTERSLLSEVQRVCTICKATTISVDDQNWLPQFSNRSVTGDVPEYEYGNENRFVVLTFHGSLIPVQIGKPLSEQDADLANEMTSSDEPPPHEDPDLETIAPDHPWMGLWRGTCLPTDPNKMIGWASVEHPVFQSEERPEIQSDEKIASSSGSIYALFLERWDGNDDPLHSRAIFTVLLVRRVSILGFNESFERVGVGRLFGEEVDKRVSSTEKTTISLV